jgi:hypothetical protein
MQEALSLIEKQVTAPNTKRNDGILQRRMGMLRPTTRPSGAP